MCKTYVKDVVVGDCGRQVHVATRIMCRNSGFATIV
jgi:hypothetical protein